VPGLSPIPPHRDVTGILSLWHVSPCHTADLTIPNMRRAGVHNLVIMAITGHKITAMFMRYNTVSMEELKAAAGKLGRRGDLYGDHAALETRNEASGNG
jgi:hypothetical protein